MEKIGDKIGSLAKQDHVDTVGHHERLSIATNQPFQMSI